MTFLTPLYAAYAAAVLIPALIILYFLKLRRRDLEVSTTLLWKKAIQDLQANAPFQKLRRNILLILQLLALGAAIFALGQPQIRSDLGVGERNIILIDRSASMSAVDGDPDLSVGDRRIRLEAAKREAISLIESLREPGLFQRESADQAMVIAFDSSAEVVEQFTTDKKILKAAVESIKPTDAPTSMKEAMRLAKAYAPKRIVEGKPVEGLEGGLPATIHLWSDGRIPDSEESKPGDQDSFIFHRVGVPEAVNIGIVGLRAERAYDQPQNLSVFVALTSTMPAARQVDVELLVDGAVVAIKQVTVPPATTAISGGETGEPQASDAAAGEGAPPAGATPPRPTPGTAGIVFPMERSEGAVMQVRLRGLDSTSQTPVAELDALDADNRAWLVVPPAKRMSVAVVTRGNLFISAALKGLPLARHEQMSPEEFTAVLKSGKAGEFDVIVLDAWLPPVGAGEVGLPPGRYVVLGEVPSGAGLIDRGKGPPSIFMDWSRQHPVMRNVTLDPVIIAESRLVDVRSRNDTPPTAPAEEESNGKTDADAGKAAKGAATNAAGQPLVESPGASLVIAETDQGPGIVESTGQDWRAVVVPFDVARSNWPFDVSFVVFLASAVDYIGGGQGGASGLDRLVRPGEVISARLPAGADDARAKTPEGAEEPIVVAADGRAVFGPVRSLGVYEITWKGIAGPGDRQDGGRAVRPYAADLLDSQESDIGATDELMLATGSVTRLQQQRANLTTKLWPYFVLGALGLVMLEWFVYNRKVHV